jgi:hypothetical protein
VEVSLGRRTQRLRPLNDNTVGQLPTGHRGSVFSRKSGSGEIARNDDTLGEKPERFQVDREGK